jgi:four helix bundle protein
MSAKSPGYDKKPPVSPDYRTFEDLDAYKAAQEFRKDIYAVARRLPDFEKFGLASQIRRAAVSLTNNLAEGHGRFHWLDQIKFTLQSRGSLEELIDDLNICEDETYLPDSEVLELKERAWRVHKIIAGYLRYLRERKQGESFALREDSPGYDISESDLDDLIGTGDSASTLQLFNSSTKLP